MPIKVLAISDYREFHSVRPEAEIFIGLKKEGLDVHVMTYGDSEYAKRFRDAGIKVFDFHPDSKFDKEEQKFIRDLLVKEDYDIIHLFNSRAILHGLKATKGLKAKIVLYRGYSGNIHWYDPTAYAKFLNPRVDAIMCNSKGVEEIIRNQKILNKQKAVTINKGHRTAWYSDVEPSNIRNEFNIPEDAFLLINVANNRKMKGIPYLLQAMNTLPADLNIHLILLGKGMDDKDNMDLINNSAYRDKIHLPGFRPDALSVVASSDVFVLPSIMGESITKSVIEAMSLEKTPIITDIAGNQELVEDGISGIVVPKKNPKALADAILHLYNNRELCTKMAKKAKERIDTELSTEVTVQKVKQLYEELLNTK
ncbi:MAG: glycosyltransferase family 4 protein [Crocinitomicaceae bacterium]|nr:glycosyltransferase family 4 protein [Crocinitomicaceae bacterium]